MTNGPGSDAFGADLEVSTLDLVLGQGSATALAAARRAVADDPLRALEVAEMRDFVESCRALCTPSSGRYAAKLADVMQRAERRVHARRPTSYAPFGRFLLAAAAAVGAFAALRHYDPLTALLHTAEPTESRLVMALGPHPNGETDVPAVAAPATPDAWESCLDAMQRRLGVDSPQLRLAVDAARTAHGDPLAGWVDPRNALVMLQLDHELRQSPAVREQALEQRGSLRSVDHRVQQLADDIAVQLLDRCEERSADLATVGLGVRAILAAGVTTPLRREALTRGCDWLAARVPDASGMTLAQLLVPLSEAAGVVGRHVDLVARHGSRLLDEVLADDVADPWSRWWPELLSARMPSALVAETSRLCERLPAFDVPADRCRLLRELLLGNLRERRDHGADGPDVLAALLYGCGDLLAEEVRSDYERQLRRWKPARLAPDFVTVQQLAWAIPPGRIGATRWLRELRGLAVLTTPVELHDRAAFCLGLATPFAAWPLATAHAALGE